MRKSGIIITVLLLIVVLALMLVSTGLIPLSLPQAQNTFQGMSFRTRLDEKTEHTTEVKPKLKAKVAHGQINVQGAFVEEIQITANVQVKATTAVRAQELIRETLLEIATDTDENIVQALTPQLRSNESVRVDLNILVPIQTNLDLKTSLGDIEIKNIEGNAILETALGNIKISDSKFDKELDASTNLGDLNIAASLAQENNLASSLGDLNLLLSSDEAYILEGSIGLGNINVKVPFKGRQDKNHIQGIIGEGEQRGTILLNVSLGSLLLKNQANGRD